VAQTLDSNVIEETKKYIYIYMRPLLFGNNFIFMFLVLYKDGMPFYHAR